MIIILSYTSRSGTKILEPAVAAEKSLGMQGVKLHTHTLASPGAPSPPLSFLPKTYPQPSLVLTGSLKSSQGTQQGCRRGLPQRVEQLFRRDGQGQRHGETT